MYCVMRSRCEELDILYLLRLLQPLFIFPPLRFIRRTDGILPTVGALLRLDSATEKEVAVITSINHFISPAIFKNVKETFVSSS